MEVVAATRIFYKRILERYVKVPWLRVLDGLTAIERRSARGNSKGRAPMDDFPSRVRVWREFGDKLGISEDTVRSEEAALSSTMEGCSWYKCPLSQELVNSVLLLCVGCHKVWNRLRSHRGH